MASTSSLLPEEQFQCSICLDEFSEPVSISCGHNFCKACIGQHWDTTDLCQCPVCRETFDVRPKLRTNTFISEMAAHFRKSAQGKEKRSPEHLSTEPLEVACDVCTGTRLTALKSCLECLTSFCETHLQPHLRVTGLKRHKLIDPVGNLEDRMCKKHDRLLELFCRTDETCVCHFCAETDHKAHRTVPVEEECGQRKAELGRKEAEVRRMIRERRQKVQEIRQSVELGKKETGSEIAHSIQVFTALVRSVERSRAEFVKVIEEKQKAAQWRAEGLIAELEQEITELERRLTALEQLSHTKDQLTLLLDSTNLCNLPPNKDWSKVSVHTDVCVGNITSSLFQLEETSREFCELEKKFNRTLEELCAAELKRMRQYSVDVTLDSDTAFQFLVLSQDRKNVRCSDTRQKYPESKKRFVNSFSVLGKKGFSSGRFYYEVQVKGKTMWWLGVASESIDRKGNLRESSDGLWTVWLNGKNGYGARMYYPVPLALRKKPQTVGVFVDYDKGQVSFYDVEARFHIYSFNGCVFTEKLYPYFNPYLSCGGENSAPLVICQSPP